MGTERKEMCKERLLQTQRKNDLQRQNAIQIGEEIDRSEKSRQKRAEIDKKQKRSIRAKIDLKEQRQVDGSKDSLKRVEIDGSRDDLNENEKEVDIDY